MAIFQKPPPTWAQLTYTSADSVLGAKGGWGIKERSAATTDFLVSEMLKGISTRIVEVAPTSNFPSDEDLRARPRRLLFRLVNGLPAMWHAATAGPDATGRPGNVYTHVAALASNDAALRPIEYWRSPGWLTPFGAADVTAARIGELPPGDAVTRQSILEFLEQGDREYAVEWLLAAVTYTVNRGHTLILATDSPDEAASWIGVFSFLTAPALARRISWVTYERAEDVEATAQRGIDIVCVPREDLEGLLESRPPDTLVLDPDWALDVPGEDKTWVAQGGQTFPADSDWAGAFLDLIALQPFQRTRVLADIDGTAASLEPAEVAVLPFHWPLTMALLSDADAVVNNRASVLFDCLEFAPAPCLASPAGKDLVAEFVSGPEMGPLLSGADFAALTSGAWNLAPALAEAMLLALAEQYLGGSWRDGGRWPTLTPYQVEKLQTGLEPRIRAALDDAVVVADGSDAQALAAAKLWSFVIQHQLVPHRRSASEPDLVLTLLGKVEARFASGALVIDPEDRQDLNARLLPAPSFSTEAHSLTARMAHVASMQTELSVTDRLPGLVQHPASDPSAILGGVHQQDGHLEADRKEPKAPALTSPPSESAFVEAAREKLRGHRLGSEDACQAARAILELSRIDPPSHREVTIHQARISQPVLEASAHLVLLDPAWNTADVDEWHRRRELMLQAFTTKPDLPEALRVEVLGWLAVVEGLCEAFRYEQLQPLPPEPDPRVLDALGAKSEPGIRHLADAVEQAELPSACRLVASAIARGVHAPTGSLLGLRLSGPTTLGLAGITAGATRIDSERTSDLRKGCTGLLDLFTKRMGSGQIWQRMNEIFPEDAPATPTKHGSWKGK